MYNENLRVFTEYVELNNHLSNESSQPQNNNTLSPWRIVLPDNLPETYVKWPCTSSQCPENLTKSFEPFWKISNRYSLWTRDSSRQHFQQDWRSYRVVGHGNCPYSHPQAISKAYNILNRTENYRDSIKSWNCLPQIHKMWIAFNTHFREAHLELTQTG